LPIFTLSHALYYLFHKQEIAIFLTMGLAMPKMRLWTGNRE